MALKKLKSNNGISILVALLLFLVCTVIGSIVLAAATAASGRISGLEESDRRYYAVKSAAELFRDALDENELTVTRQKEQDQTYTWYDDGPRGTPAEGATRYTFQYQMKGGAAKAISSVDTESLLTEATLDYVLGVGARTKSDDTLAHQPGKNFAWPEPKKLKVTNSENDKLVVDVTVETQDGALRFTFQNHFKDTPSAMENQKFTLSFTLTPTYTYLADPQTVTVEGEIQSTVVQRPDEEGNPSFDDAGNPLTTTTFTQTDTVCTDKSVTVTWTASPIVVKQGGAAG